MSIFDPKITDSLCGFDETIERIEAASPDYDPVDNFIAAAAFGKLQTFCIDNKLIQRQIGTPVWGQIYDERQASPDNAYFSNLRFDDGVLNVALNIGLEAQIWIMTKNDFNLDEYLDRKKSLNEILGDTQNIQECSLYTLRDDLNGLIESLNSDQVNLGGRPSKKAEIWAALNQVAASVGESLSNYSNSELARRAARLADCSESAARSYVKKWRESQVQES